jgi:hypothetical protein
MVITQVRDLEDTRSKNIEVLGLIQRVLLGSGVFAWCLKKQQAVSQSYMLKLNMLQLV